MAKAPFPMVRKNLSLPESVAKRLDAIRVARSKVSDSEAIREMIGLMEIITGKKGCDLVLKDRATGAEKIIPT